MTNEQTLTDTRKNGRSFANALSGDPALGPLSQLPGVWKNLPDLPGRGWNLIALPFVQRGT
jgi:hypothetical protein